MAFSDAVKKEAWYSACVWRLKTSKKKAINKLTSG